MTRSPTTKADRSSCLLAIQQILEAADRAQQGGDWKLAAQLVEQAFAALDELSDPEEPSLPA